MARSTEGSTSLEIEAMLAGLDSCGSRSRSSHRDLKPANILIDGRGEVLIADLWLAAIAGSISPAQVRDGTMPYMSPEQLAGREVTVRSDIYALGLVLYEAFTGRPAFHAASIRIA
jgi:serine/threonine-protein kinase